MKRIEGKEHLVKDKSGCIINTDTDAYNAARQHKLRLLKEKKEKQALIDRIDKLEQMILAIGSKLGVDDVETL